jgi:hypothetical protein
MHAVLTDVANDVWVDAFDADGPGWRVRKRTLRGGLRDGIDLVSVTVGDLTVSILPTRGMGIWRGEYRGIRLGWDAPVVGPVHPKFVNQADRGGLGWLTGFDEWLCRCGLAWNGPPGTDRGWPLTLHGRIANLPAHFVSVMAAPDCIEIRGIVDEGGLFYPSLRLETVYRLRPGDAVIEVSDSVTNLGDTPAEMQLLYHLNVGPPLLQPGGSLAVPVKELWPLTAHAAAGLAEFGAIADAVPGFREQVYCVRPAADGSGMTTAALVDASKTHGLSLRWNVNELPFMNVWKNTAGLRDGYVAGLEPATGFPRFKVVERNAGHVIALPAGERWSANWSIRPAADAASVEKLIRNVESCQARTEPLVHREPLT